MNNANESAIAIVNDISSDHVIRNNICNSRTALVTQSEADRKQTVR